MTDTPGDEVHDQSPIAERLGTSTDHPRIDEALTRLDGLDDLEITQHPGEFDAIHRVLRESLASAGRDGDPPELP